MVYTAHPLLALVSGTFYSPRLTEALLGNFPKPPRVFSSVTPRCLLELLPGTFLPLKTRAIIIGLVVFLLQIHGGAHGALWWSRRQGHGGIWAVLHWNASIHRGMPLASASPKPFRWTSGKRLSLLTKNWGPPFLSPQLWTWESERENPTLTLKLTGLLPCVGTGPSHRWISKWWHSWKTTFLCFPCKLKP